MTTLDPLFKNQQNNRLGKYTLKFWGMSLLWNLHLDSDKRDSLKLCNLELYQASLCSDLAQSLWTESVLSELRPREQSLRLMLCTMWLNTVLSQTTGKREGTVLSRKLNWKASAQKQFNGPPLFFLLEAWTLASSQIGSYTEKMVSKGRSREGKGAGVKLTSGIWRSLREQRQPWSKRGRW